MVIGDFNAKARAENAITEAIMGAHGRVDHIRILRNFRRTMEDVKVCRGADVDSDHFLLVSKLRLKLKAVPEDNNSRKK